MWNAPAAGKNSGRRDEARRMARISVDRQRITPFLWYDEGVAAEAARFYTSIFPNSRIELGDGGADSLEREELAVTFWLDGQRFIALNGGPQFSFTPAVSFFVRCETQAELDYYWDALLVGGEPSRCGWLRDRFGLSWQIVPDVLGDLLASDDRDAAARAMTAMLGMQKIDIAELLRAARGDAVESV